MENEASVLTDQFGRKHDYLRISLTERCNLRCFYCMPENGIQLKENAEYMTKSEVVSIAKTFVNLGVKKIRLTGGEPLVRKDASEIIEELAALPIELAITTNGILLDKFLDQFKRLNITAINVSLDTLNETKFNNITRRNYFEKVRSNIKLFLNNGFKLKINAVLIKGVNDDELIDFVEFTKDKEIDYRFIEFMPFNGNKWDWSKGLSLHEINTKISSVYGASVMKLQDGKNDTAKSFKIENYKGTFSIISSITNPFCDSCNRIRLTADGQLKNCLFSNSESNLLKSFRNGDSLEAIILDSILNKKKIRGGMNSHSDILNAKNIDWKRSMVSIGG
ncbi:MAG: GTP 3',8-cyclase MoaA [Bacteroidia bacterium]|nr:GTP 3',8-cyclase MoaA [Bacteroidia bacterium]